jgi:hypothetical protein
LSTKRFGWLANEAREVSRLWWRGPTDRLYIIWPHLKNAYRFLFSALDTPGLLHAGKKLMKIKVLHFKSSSIVRLSSLS